MYDEADFEPSMSELVMVHMVFATIYYQYGVRNPEDAVKRDHLNGLANKHYHWCLSKLYEVAMSSALESIQAYVLLAAFMRSFPKPGSSLSVVNFAFAKAIEMNLHRALKSPSGITNRHLEIRKRCWWVLLALVVTLNGRLGRPMPIELEDFDVEFPLAIPDECLGEDGVLNPARTGQCDFQIGLTAFKLVPLYLKMFTKIYSVRRDPSRYCDVVKSLDEGLRLFRATLPDDVRVDKCKPGQQLFALYTEAFCLEFTLCLRHPSVCLTDDPVFVADNARICEETARKLLKVVSSLVKMKSLDTTWYQLSVYIAAMFSTLAACWERRFQTTAFEIASLRQEMAQWLVVVSEIGKLLGRSHDRRAEPLSSR